MSNFNHPHAVPDFVEKFGTALGHFQLRIRETASIHHRVSKGTERELDIAEFLRGLLPAMYSVAGGEVVDLRGKKSPQLDVMVYDSLKNFPFYKSETFSVLPAEALLASIEIKSVLTLSEIEKSYKAAAELKALQPMKKPLGGSSVGSGKGSYRFFHGIFAYQSDLSKEDWAKAELRRFDNKLTPASGQRSSIDFVYVLHRGMLNLNSRKWISEDAETARALIALYFALLNFIDRENRRRVRAPYFQYASRVNAFWADI